MPDKKWKKPMLTVLVRGKPEEAILAACKGTGGTSLQGHHSGCRFGFVDPCNNRCNIEALS